MGFIVRTVVAISSFALWRCANILSLHPAAYTFGKGAEVSWVFIQSIGRKASALDQGALPSSFWELL